jgi:hypothetical protein
MGAFRSQAPEIPGGNSVWQVGSGVSFLGVDEIWELDGISDEEDWGVVSNHVPVSFFGVKLDCVTSGVSGGIGRSLLTSDSGETEEDWGGFSDFTEKFGLGVFGDIMGGFEVAMGSSAFGMDDSFRNSFPVEMGKLINKMNVIKGNRAVFSSGHGVLVIVNGSTVGCGKGFGHILDDILCKYYEIKMFLMYDIIV